MARPLRIEFAGAIQHVISRGNAGEQIFSDKNDYTTFLAVLAAVVDRFGWVIYAYCLMPNHYHLVFETPGTNLSAGMKYLNGVYTQRFNRRHDRTGHVLQGRFRSILVDRDAYLHELCRYVVLNPVRAGLAPAPEHWKWSSFAPAMGKAPKPRFLDPGRVLSLFAGRTDEAREDYRRFVAEGIGKQPSWCDSEVTVVMGDNGFLRQIIPLVTDRACAEQLAKLERRAGRPSLERILSSHRGNGLPVSAIRDAHIRYGYRLRDVADFLDVDLATLTRALNQGQPKVKTERDAICEL